MSALFPDAIVLLAHGSPDPDWMVPVDATAALMRTHAPGTPVRTATLEHGRGLAEIAAELAAAGLLRVAVIPLFLSPGGRHIKRDVPALVNSVQQQFPTLSLRLSPGAIGTDAPVLEALARAALRRAGLSELS